MSFVINIDPLAYDFLVSRFYDVIEQFSVELNNFRVMALRDGLYDLNEVD